MPSIGKSTRRTAAPEASPDPRNRRPPRSAGRRVDFSYGGIRARRREPAQPGSVVHLAGRSGSGKSTLCKLLMRFEMPRAAWWRWARMRANTASLRETQELHDTGNRIAFRRHHKPSLLAAERLARRAGRSMPARGGVERFDRSAAPGLDTPVGELETLSGGERQRMSLAARVHDAPFVLLDEPRRTSTANEPPCSARSPGAAATVSSCW